MQELEWEVLKLENKRLSKEQIKKLKILVAIRNWLDEMEEK